MTTLAAGKAQQRTRPPFRADMVGSILRTAPLKEARAIVLKHYGTGRG